MIQKTAIGALIQSAVLMAGLSASSAGAWAATQPANPGSVSEVAVAANSDMDDCDTVTPGSPYIPVDSWVYPAVLRLYSMGYIDTVYLGLRPWTRQSVRNMLEEAADRLEDTEDAPGASEAQQIYDALNKELSGDPQEGDCSAKNGAARIESVYSVMRGITGTPLRDSFHLGSTIINDYGRPYQNGANNYTGASGYATLGRFVLYARGEFQGAPSATGYSAALTNQLAAVDQTTYFFNPQCWLNQSAANPACVPMPNSLQRTIPFGSIGTTTTGRILEAYISAQYLNHIISFGKQDEWQGPGIGGAMAYSNNAENIYAFHVTRIEPLELPLLSRLTGPFRYEFMIGPLKGHTYPIDPWVHEEKLSFRPTENLEFGFQRTVIWGGKGHEPVNLKSFLRSFFSLSAPDAAKKNSPQDPGARFGAFDCSYRLPYFRNFLTLYVDGEVHDDVSPIDAPRRASWRPGIYLARVPGLSKLDVRFEGVTTDPNVLANPNNPNNAGAFMYWEYIQRQGYTNNGQLLGDWIGREDKGGQAWITYHLSGNEMVQVGVRNQKAEKDFIPHGTTLNDLNFRVVKRIRRDIEIDGRFAFEHWKAPVYQPGQQTTTTTTVQFTWFPDRKVTF